MMHVLNFRLEVGGEALREIDRSLLPRAINLNDQIPRFEIAPRAKNRDRSIGTIEREDAAKLKERLSNGAEYWV